MVSNFFLLTSVALFDAFSVQPRGYKRRWLLLPLSPRCWDQTVFCSSPQSSSWQGFAIARQCQGDPPQWLSLWQPSTLLEHLMSMFGLGRRSRFDGDTSSLLIWLRCDFFFFFFFFCHRCLTSILFIWLISISLDKCCFHLIGSDAWEPWIAATPCREELPPSAPCNQSQDVSVFSTTHIFQYHTSPYWFKLIDTTSRPCHTGLRIYRFMSTALVVSIIFVAPNFSTVLHNSVHISTLLHTVLHFSTNFHTVSILTLEVEKRIITIITIIAVISTIITIMIIVAIRTIKSREEEEGRDEGLAQVRPRRGRSGYRSGKTFRWMAI